MSLGNHSTGNRSGSQAQESSNQLQLDRHFQENSQKRIIELLSPNQYALNIIPCLSLKEQMKFRVCRHLAHSIHFVWNSNRFGIKHARIDLGERQVRIHLSRDRVTPHAIRFRSPQLNYRPEEFFASDPDNWPLLMRLNLIEIFLKRFYPHIESDLQNLSCFFEDPDLEIQLEIFEHSECGNNVGFEILPLIKQQWAENVDEFKLSVINSFSGNLDSFYNSLRLFTNLKGLDLSVIILYGADQSEAVLRKMFSALSSGCSNLNTLKFLVSHETWFTAPNTAGVVCQENLSYLLEHTPEGTLRHLYSHCFGMSPGFLIPVSAGDLSGLKTLDVCLRDTDSSSVDRLLEKLPVTLEKLTIDLSHDIYLLQKIFTAFMQKPNRIRSSALNITYAMCFSGTTFHREIVRNSLWTVAVVEMDELAKKHLIRRVDGMPNKKNVLQLKSGDVAILQFRFIE